MFLRCRVVLFARRDPVTAIRQMHRGRPHRGGPHRGGPYRGGSPYRGDRSFNPPPAQDTASSWFGRTVQERSSRGRDKRRRRPQENETPSLPSHRDLEWYRTLFGRCIEQELKEEQLQVEERLRTWSLERLIREGYTLTYCQARFHGRLFDKRIVRFSQQREKMFSHIFTHGDLVTISRCDWMSDLCKE